MESALPIINSSPVTTKIRIFRALFRGRQDIYPVRWESTKTGKSGYGPACENEWVRGICAKRKDHPDHERVSCGSCAHCRFLPVTDEVIQWHLLGEDPRKEVFVAGVYALLPDETCWFLAMDFDKATWREDAAACRDTCLRLGLPVAVERSRSGNGAHLWLFFEEPLPAALARRLGCHILTETLERHPLRLSSYDRLFPCQDTMPQGGFGNLIALPLQKGPRSKGNSVFVDEHFEPWQKQWPFLRDITRLPRLQAEQIVQEAERQGKVLWVRMPPEEEDPEPWTAPPSRRRRAPPIAGELPKAMELVLGNQIYVAKDGLPPGLRNRLLCIAAFQNPEFYRKQRNREYVHDTPRIVACAEDHGKYIGLPRGCLEDVQRLLTDLGVHVTLCDERFTGRPLAVRFQGELRSEQAQAAHALLAHDTGVLAATTAFGKTVIGAWLIAQRGVSTLVLVHSKELLRQWRERLAQFLAVPAKQIGQIGGGGRRPTGVIDVGMLQSLYRHNTVDDCVAGYGQVIVDECHHVAAKNFEAVARQLKARYVAGLSATVARKDGLHPIIFMQCGPIRHRVDARAQAAARPFAHTVLVKPTAFQSARSPEPKPRLEFQALCQELAADAARNQRICDDVVEAARAGRSPLVLTERIDHLDRMDELLASRVHHLIVFRAGMGVKQRRALGERMAAISREEERVVLATSRYIGEGFDDPRLDTLFLTLPVSWKGRIEQYAGRLHRLYDGKREAQICDYADLDVPMLERMFDRRCRSYKSLGYTITLPASAIPAWPAEVILPAAPLWARDYAATVRRLVRDGVDGELGSLFLQAVQPVAPDAQGVDRARSATEAFLFRRLETIEGTKGRFRVNERLPIAFDGTGALEVDILCPDARVAIELDGPQHLGDVEAYRRDRRKDLLLQANGYLVLRFLTEDVGRDLQRVLDTILSALTRK
jgi:superfamily II DNA or RNA helicase/very-short-patch-repair endonuclease